MASIAADVSLGAATLSAAEIIEACAARWNVETTFAEMPWYLGLETTRG